jgi:succinoglycan biosynthesis transport protein ExoP
MTNRPLELPAPDPGRMLPAIPGAMLPGPPLGRVPDAREYDDQDLDLRDLWRVIVRRKWVVAWVFLIVVIATAIATSQITPIYRSTATLQIDRQQSRIVKYEDVNPAAENQEYGFTFLNTYVELARSRALAERVVTQLSLQERSIDIRRGTWQERFASLFGDGNPPADEARAAERQAEDRKDAIVTAFMKALIVEPVRNSRIVRISFDSPDRELSARVANAVGRAFIELNLERRMDASSYAKTFLEERLEQVRARLEDSERKLVGFARKQEIVTVGEKQTLSTARLDQVQQELNKVELERVKLESAWKQLQDANSPLSNMMLDNLVVQEYKKSKAKLEVEYQDQLKIYKPGFPKMLQLTAQIEDLQAKIDREVAVMRAAIKAELDGTIKRHQTLAGMLSQAKTEVLTVQDRSIDYTILKREVDTNRNLYDGLLQRLKEVGVAGGVESNNIQVVDKAEVPRLPHSPRYPLNLGIACIAGLLLGIMLAFVFERVDDTFRDPDDIERMLGLAVLGVVPLADGELAENPEKMATASLGAPRSMFAESYRSMRTALQFSTGSGAPKVLGISSAVQGEGKTITAINLAIAFAQTGATVLLIDADLRNPSLHKKLGLDGMAGLSSYLVGRMGPEDVTRAGPAPNLFVIPAGHLPPNPAELLGGARMMDLITTARERFTHVIIDGPPILAIADSLVLGAVCDAMVLVVAAISTQKGATRDALKRLRHVRENVIGGVLTKYDGRGRAYSYYSHYYYGDQTANRLSAG